ncbi:MAG: sigma-54-dependent Fis family transcriptional regulator [candidate division Zixibacteria bacterium]|nr:sigma-54-dependent Fis family transcriptional regulator [candidate division Zixibacteria bacterium]
MITSSRKAPIDILLLDIKSDQNSSLSIAIPELLHRFKQVTSLASARTELGLKNYPILIVMIDNESSELISAISQLTGEFPNTEILAAINPGNQELAAKAINAGAADYLLNPINSDILLSKITAITASKNNMSELMMLRQQIAMNYGFDNFIGVSLKIERIRKTAMQMALCDIPVVISGKTGTGKTLLANIIHYHSLRRKNELNRIDCSSATKEFIETELKRIFDSTSVDASTVFISHLESMELDSQRLLTQLIALNQNKSLSDDQPAMPRLILSCDQPLYNLVRKNLVDSRLVEMLQAIEISIPSLIDRIEDIEVLASYYLRKYAFEIDSPSLGITSAAIEKLSKHDWSGNVRELENCLKRAVTICQEKNLDAVSVTFVGSGRQRGRLTSALDAKSSQKSSLADSQRLHITKALEDNNWNFTHTALQLGIGRTTLWRKVRKFKLQRNEESETETLGVYSDEQHQ